MLVTKIRELITIRCTISSISDTPPSRKLSGTENSKLGHIRILKFNIVLREKLSDHRLDTFRFLGLAFNLIAVPKIKLGLINLEFHAPPLVHVPHILEPTETNKPREVFKPVLLSNPIQNPRSQIRQLTRRIHALFRQPGVDLLLVFLHAADPVGQRRFRLQREDAARRRRRRCVVPEETETEDGAAEGEIVLGGVEEEVALVECFEVEGSEESGEAEVSGGG